jgi:hypothetical protein
MQLFAFACAVLLVTPAAVTRTHAQQAAMPQDSFLLTVFLKHDQSKTLDQINEQLKHQDYYKKFPPPGVEIVSWYVMMGIGQVVTLRVPANRLRDVNRAIEQSAWVRTAPSFIRPTTSSRSPRNSAKRSRIGLYDRPPRGA